MLSLLLQFYLEDLGRDLIIRDDCWHTCMSVCRSQQSHPRVHKRWTRGGKLGDCLSGTYNYPSPWIADKVCGCRKRKVRWCGSPWWTPSKLHLSPLPFWVSLWLYRTVYVGKTVLDLEAEGEGWVDAGNILLGFKSYFSTALTDPGKVFISLLQYFSFPISNSITETVLVTQSNYKDFCKNPHSML